MNLPTENEQGWRDALAILMAREAKPIEKFGHQPRVYALTQQIGRDIRYDDDVVYAAAWLHDLGVFAGHRPDDPAELARWDHIGYAVEHTPAILAAVGFPMQKLSGVLECIRNHQPEGEPQTLESTILRDADILEQLGAVGILRTICKIGRDTRFHTFSQAVERLTVAVETLPRLLRLPSSRRLAEERIATHRAFLRSLAAEADDLLL